MDTQEHKFLLNMVEAAISINKKIDKIENNLMPGAPWSISWAEGCDTQVMVLDGPQRELIETRIITDLNSKLESIEKDIASYVSQI